MLAEANARQTALIKTLKEQNHTIIQRTEELDVAHRELIDTARRAGMAEVATSVLHNVGNLLNTAVTSSTVTAALSLSVIVPTAVSVSVDGIPAVLFLPYYSADELMAAVEQAIRLFYPRLVLGVSDEVPEGAPAESAIEKIRMVSEYCRNWETQA